MRKASRSPSPTKVAVRPAAAAPLTPPVAAARPTRATCSLDFASSTAFTDSGHVQWNDGQPHYCGFGSPLFPLVVDKAAQVACPQLTLTLPVLHEEPCSELVKELVEAVPPSTGGITGALHSFYSRISGGSHAYEKKKAILTQRAIIEMQTLVDATAPAQAKRSVLWTTYCAFRRAGFFMDQDLEVQRPLCSMLHSQCVGVCHSAVSA
jgi:hypothetical protein